MALIECLAACNVSLRREAVIFRHINFSVHPGSALLVRGPNGSGKTTLLRLIAGFGKPSTGGFILNGEPIKPERHMDVMSGRIHMVFPRIDAMKEVLTVHDNLDFWNVLYGGSNERLEYAYDRLGIGYLRDRKVSELSTGQRRILSMARILASYCQLWLLDEPTIALDKRNMRVVEDVIREHRRTGGIVLVASHADIALENAVSLELS